MRRHCIKQDSHTCSQDKISNLFHNFSKTHNIISMPITFKAVVRDFSLPLPAVRVITKTLKTCAYITGSAVAYSIATVVAVKTVDKSV